MRTEDLEYIIEVYKTQSISKAAEHLNISSQGLGKAIKNVEDNLQCSLFLRSSSGAIPTAICERIIKDIIEIKDKTEKVKQLVLDYKDVQGPPVYFMAMDSVMGSMIDSVVQKYNQEYNKNIRVLLRPLGDEHNFEKEFEEKEYEFRLCTKELIEHDIFATYNISRLHFHPIVSAKSSLVRKTNLTIKDFDGMTLLVGSRRPYTYHFSNLCKKNNVNIKIKESFDKFYISKLLSENPEYFFLGQRADVNKMIGVPGRDLMILKLEPPFETNIVVQSRSGEIDARLLNSIRQATISFSDRYLD